MKRTTVTNGMPLRAGLLGMVRLAQDPRSQYHGIVAAVGSRGKWVKSGDYEGALAVCVAFHSDDWRALFADRGDEFEAVDELEPGEELGWQGLRGKFEVAIRELHRMTFEEMAAALGEEVREHAA